MKLSKMIEVKVLFIFLQILSLFLLTSAALQGNETNRDDLNSIESDFEEKLRATDFKSNLTINNLSLNQLKQLYLKHRIRGQLNFDLISLYEKNYINCSADPSNRTVVDTTYAYVENNSPWNQTKFTTGFERYEEKRDEFTFDRTFEFSISAGAKITIPILNVPISAGIEIDASFSEHVSVTRTTIEREKVIAPPQPVNVGPYSTVKVIYKVVQYVATLNNLLDYEVTPHAKGLFAFFLKKMGNAVYGQGDLKLEYSNGKAIMRNFPETEKLRSFGIEIYSEIWI